MVWLTFRFFLKKLEAEDVPCAPVLTRSEAIAHPQAIANNIIMEPDHHRAGTIRQTRQAAHFSKTTFTVRRGGPALGEHTQEILSEIGYTTKEIEAIRSLNKDWVKW